MGKSTSSSFSLGTTTAAPASKSTSRKHGSSSAASANANPPVSSLGPYIPGSPDIENADLYYDDHKASRSYYVPNNRFAFLYHIYYLTKPHLTPRNLSMMWLAVIVALLSSDLAMPYMSSWLAYHSSFSFDTQAQHALEVSIQRRWEHALKLPPRDLKKLTISIYTAPKPFVGVDAVNQLKAIESWLALRPKPRITFLGYAEGYNEVSSKYGITIDERVDTNFAGIPLFNSMVARANESRAHVAVLMNSDIMLFDDFIHVLRKVMNDYEDWFIAGARWDIDTLPDVSRMTAKKARRVLMRYVRQFGSLHTYGGIDLWAWNTKGPPLFQNNMPHFIYGRGKYDNWLTHEAIAASRRTVIDVSEACTLVHLKHDYHLVSSRKMDKVLSGLAANRTNESQLKSVQKRSFWNQGKGSKFELYINNYLAMTHGTYHNQMGTILHAPFKIGSCYEKQALCNFFRKRPHECRCEYSTLVASTQNDPYAVNMSRAIFCGMVSVSTNDASAETLGPALTGRVNPLSTAVANAIAIGPADTTSAESAAGKSHPFGFPLTLDSLLEFLFAGSTDPLEKSIIMTVATSANKNLLMNFICNMRLLGVSNFIVAAMDDEMYRYSVVRGLPVYLEDQVFRDSLEEQYVTASLQSAEARRIMQSIRFRITRKVLRLGYNVLWTDITNVWFGNPLKRFSASNFPDFAFLLGSTESDNDGKSLALSSSMFFAKSNTEVLAVLEAWDKAAAAVEKTNGSKEEMDRTPSVISANRIIYEILCGPRGEFRRGNTKCEPTRFKVSLSFLDQMIFLDGESAHKAWGLSPGKIMSKYPNALVLTNDPSKAQPNARQMMLVRHGFVFIDVGTDMCIYPKDP